MGFEKLYINLWLPPFKSILEILMFKGIYICLKVFEAFKSILEIPIVYVVIASGGVTVSLSNLF